MTSQIEPTIKKNPQNAATSSMVLWIIHNTFDINFMSSPGQQQWMECQAGAINKARRWLDSRRQYLADEHTHTRKVLHPLDTFPMGVSLKQEKPPQTRWLLSSLAPGKKRAPSETFLKTLRYLIFVWRYLGIRKCSMKPNESVNLYGPGVNSGTLS